MLEGLQEWSVIGRRRGCSERAWRQEGGRLPVRGIEGLALGQGKGLVLGL